MQTLTCDICKKKVDNPITGLSYFYLYEHEICEACKDNLELQIKSIMREKEPFAYEWYGKLIQDSIEKAKAKGK